MEEIKKALQIIKDSAYFDAWKGVFLSESAPKEWEYLLKHVDSDEMYLMLGEKLHLNNVPYVIVSEYIDEFFRYYKQVDNAHDIKNKIAQAYLNRKLQHDYDLIEEEINKKISISLESKKDLINAHLRWMQSFILSIIEKPRFFELDPTKCFVGRWIIEEDAGSLHPKIVEIHTNLHAMTQSALRMHKRKDYAYFLLLYMDILMSSYQIRDIIMNIYFSRRLNSIYEDPLTKHGNYFQLRQDIEKQTKPNTLLILNIKEFSKINLLYGHDEGDMIIKNVLEFILKYEHLDQVYRIYGDEFGVLLPLKDNEEIVDDLKKKLESEVFYVRNNEISLSFYGSYATASYDALEKCEYGLMLSRMHYGEVSNVDTISDETLKEYADNITIGQQLRLAFMDDRIIPYFQAIYDLKQEKITKYEVLMRVEDINANILVPAQFLDVMHGMHIYPEVTKLIIKKSFEAFVDTDYDFSINLSFADIINLDTEAFILAIIKQYPETAKRCTFELLETEAIHNHAEVSSFFDLLHEQGVKIALDDFGVGYSNYDTIFKFDIDYIKIDGSLTESLLTSERSRVLIESIITVARKLDAKLIVEFVSSEELFYEIAKMDVDYMQGYFIGKPNKDFS